MAGLPLDPQPDATPPASPTKSRHDDRLTPNGHGNSPDRESPPRPSKRQRAPIIPARDLSNYDLLSKIGDGTFGEVWKAQEKGKNVLLALKLIKMETEKEGFPITALREIQILSKLHHPNIVRLKEVVHGVQGTPQETDVCMVFEYVDHDLAGLLDQEAVQRLMSAQHVKCWMKQLLEGMAFCQKNGILHRDLKCANLLVSTSNELKIADWGLARNYYDSAGSLTLKVITQWYRPPELLLKAQKYDYAVDMWSVGCVFAELLRPGQALFPGNSEAEMLDLIFSLCGTPEVDATPDSNGDVFPNENDHLDWHAYKQKCKEQPRPSTLHQQFSEQSEETRRLLEALLTLDPKKRITASNALHHPYFHDEDPKLVEPAQLIRFNIQACHELESRNRRSQDMKVQNGRGTSGAQRSQSNPYRPTGSTVRAHN